METQAGWVLVVDGDQSAYALYRQVLGELGFAVDLCGNGTQALLALSRRNFDLVLIDPRAPDVQGIDVLSQVYRQPAPPSVVVLSADLQPDMLEASVSQAGPGLLAKPFDDGQLRATIEAVGRERDARLSQGIGQANRVVTRTGDEMHPLYLQIVRIVLARFQADRVSLMLWNDGSDLINVVASEGFPFAKPGDTSALLHDSLSGWVIRHMEPLLLEPDSPLPFDMQSSWRNNALFSGMCVPIAVRGRVLGVLTAARRAEKQAYTSTDLDSMIALTYQAAWIIEYMQIQLQSQRRTQFLVRLYNLSNALLAAKNVPALLQITLEHLSETLPDASGYVLLRDGESPGIEQVATLNASGRALTDLDELRDDPGLVGQVLADGVPRLRQATDLRELALWEQRLLDDREQVLCCVALKTDIAVYGAIEIVSRPVAFGEEELQYLVAAAALIAPAIEKVQRYATAIESAGRYGAIFQNAPDALLLIDLASGTIVASNPAAERLSGYSQAELAAIAPARLIAPNRAGRAGVTIADVLAGRVADYEGYLRTRSGYNVLVSLAAGVLGYDNTRYLMLAIRNSAELQRQAQRQAQQEKLDGMTRLTASIAHEINNPLQALHNTLHLLVSRQFADDKRERLLSMAQMEVDRLTAIVRRMLDLHRPAVDDMRPSSVHSLLDGALAGLAPQLQQHHVLLERDWHDRLPRVMAIGGHLKQVFHDLIINAVEAMPSGGRLTIRTRSEENGDSAARVLIDFIDNGPGITENEAKLIFEPFYTTKRTNVGLGLAVSYSIVERHGGSISVSSSPGGSTFRVSLPAAHSIEIEKKSS